MPSIDGQNADKIAALEKKLSAFYASNPNYYGDIDFTAENWNSDVEVGYREIADRALSAGAVCEFGCGNANILKYYKEITPKYKGCDFSPELINRNRKK
ncbi:MAG: hypothetical protein JST39_11530, partial [Bacteroidetes bacterium]|nr:hypothetical protein [Bacteroidota bacterium]